MKGLVGKIDRKALAKAVAIMLLGWLALPIIYYLIVRKKKKEEEVKKEDGESSGCNNRDCST